LTHFSKVIGRARPGHPRFPEPVEKMEITPADGLPCGLSTDEARRRLAESGPNATPDTDIHPVRLVLGNASLRRSAKAG
jgi:hypothetical protein